MKRKPSKKKKILYPTIAALSLGVSSVGCVDWVASGNLQETPPLDIVYQDSVPVYGMQIDTGDDWMIAGGLQEPDFYTGDDPDTVEDDTYFPPLEGDMPIPNPE